jgi:hypothetical protein
VFIDVWGYVFTNFHRSPLGTSNAMAMRQKRLLCFPQFHRTHHNNKLYRVLEAELMNALVVVMGPVKKEGYRLLLLQMTEIQFPLISTSFTCLVGFILCEKASTVRQRWKAARNPNERNRNRTRGTSSDGIQRYKVSAVE